MLQVGDNIKKDQFFYLILISQGLILTITLAINFYLKIEVFTYILPSEDYLCYIFSGFLSGSIIYLLLYLLSKIYPKLFKKINQIMSLIPLKKKNMFLIIVLPAIIEELFFRGVLQEILGVIGVNVLFAIAHMGKERDLIFYGILTFLIGVVLSVLYIMADNLLVPMLAHATINALTVRRLFNEQISKEKF